MKPTTKFGLGATCVLLWISAVGYAKEDIPTPSNAPVDATVAAAPVPGDAYYSPRLKAHFFTQWMYIIVNGQQHPFWGHRVVGMDAGSPLATLNLNLGDVITRLDGIPCSTGMHRDPANPQKWLLPRMERHYGITEVRYIKTGTHSVLIGTIDLGPLGGPGTPGNTPVLP